jgi:hypothetical protein
MKLVTNKETGKVYCLHCKLYDCICLPEGEPYFCDNFATKLEVREIRNLPGGKADILYFYKQTLPNGRLIKTKSSLCVPTFKWEHISYSGRLVILLSNDIINQSFY